MRNFNVILISLDCVRPDHLSCYGYNKINTKNIDSIAKESIIFTQAICQAPYTPASHASIFTGLNPYNHGIRQLHGDKLNKKCITLAETLKKHGYYCVAFIGADALNKVYSLNKGFDEYHQPSDDKKIKFAGVAVNDWTNKLVNWFSSNKNKKFFLFLHHFATHHGGSILLPKDCKKNKFFDYYDDKIKYFDEKIMALLIEELSKYNLLEKTIIIITADHGECLYEHNEFDSRCLGHRKFLYDSTLRVPLIIKIPNLKPKKIDSLVRLIDIFPTITGFLGVNFSQKIDGINLLPLILNKKKEIKYAYSETKLDKRLISIRTEKWKLIFDGDTFEPNQLYNLKKDPKELINLMYENKDIVNRLKSILINIIKSSKEEKREAMTKSDEDYIKQKLKNLGYLD
ncbi:sulfatase-like hydrolase/transferase [Candidatus Woesearchaeota archaeon]|nr:sulfatase-like hydrolase/transferase [Candidatus Woesearchaeota archaeon]